MRTTDRIGLLLLLLIVIAAMLAGCGVGHHLRMADKHERKRDRHIAKAIDLGAKIKERTFVEPIKFVAPKMEYRVNLADIIVDDTTIIRNDAGQEAKLLVDTVTNTVYIECPEQEVEKNVTTKRDVNVSAPRSLWTYLGILWWIVVGAFMLGIFIGYSLLVRTR